MNRKIWMMVTPAAFALFGAASAFAQEATQEFSNAQALSTFTRDEVRTDLRAAQHDGRVGFNEASPAPEAGAVLTRAQVVAETREAQRLGLLVSNEAGANIATPPQQASILAAGQRANSDTNLAQTIR